MSAAKKPTSRKKASTGKATARRSTKSSVKKTATRKSESAKKTASGKSPVRGASARATKKTAAGRAVPKKTATPKKTPVKKTAQKGGATARKASAPKKNSVGSPAQKTTTKKTSARAQARPAPKAPAARKSRPVRAAKFDKKALDQIKATLEQELADLRRQETELEEASFVSTQSDMTGEVGLDDDFADAGTATFDRERDLSIRNNIRDLIDQISRAIVRIDEGVYGTCERCGKPIDAARLKALPHASMCMDCKRREERAR